MKEKILIVDDDANIREGVGDILDASGYETAQAASGAEAVAQIKKASFDVILMDYNLTDGTGIDAIKQIRALNADSQILMITGNASLDAAVRAIQESVDDFLQKPVNPDQLKRAIAKSLEKMKLRQENRRLIDDLQKANDELGRLSAMKSKFMSMASHDLSNSLMTLQVSFEMLSTRRSVSPRPMKSRSRWITSPARAAQWGIDTGYVAVRPDAWETPVMKKYVADFPPAAVARDQLQFAVAELSTHDNQRVTKALNDGLQAALTGSKGADQAMKDSQREAERLLRPYRK